MLRRQDGQIFPLMAAILVSVLALGFGLFQVARAGVLRSKAQTAADAAALAAVRNAKQQLDAMQAAGGIADVALLNYGQMEAAARSYAEKNGGVVTEFPQPRGVDVKVYVKTEAQLGKDAKRVNVGNAHTEDVEGSARARARIELDSSGNGGSASGGGPGVGGNGSGDGVVKPSEWTRFKEDELDGQKPTCTDASSSNDVIKLGEFLKDHGFQIGENSHFGVVNPVHANGSYHYRCGNAGAIDVNFTAGATPLEKSKIDPLIKPLQDLGYRTIWQAEGHYDHLHVDSGTGNIGAGGGGGGFAFGDQTPVIRLIDWDAKYTDFTLYPTDGTVTATAGNPDPNVMRIMCSVLAEKNASKRVRLATYETAIVESGVRNLSYGDRDSVGVFQQREAGWGTFEQRTNVAYATNSFLAKAIALDKHWSGTTGYLAQAVQISAFGYKYDLVRNQAASLHNQYCGEPKISPDD